MENSIQNFINMCQWDSAKFLIFSDNVFGSLVYYSHLLPLVVSLLFAIFVFTRNSRLLAARWLLLTTILLSTWLFFDLVLWATEKPSFTMFFWSLVNMIEPMIYAGILLFLYAFIDKKSISFKKKLIIFSLLLPTVILTATNFNLAVYDLSNCYREAIEGPLVYYSYFIEILFVIWIIGFGINRYIQYKDKEEKKKIALATIGAVFFLLSFAMGNVVGSLLVDWEIGQYGLFGIPFFVAMLSYLVVKYHAFNIKLIATQLLVTSLWILVFAILFLESMGSVRTVVIATLFLLTILGYLLVRSVDREVKQREHIEKLARQLQIANEGQETLIHFINHQIKGYLGKSRIVFSELLNEPEYGPISEPAREILLKGEESIKEGVGFVQQILKASDIQNGKFAYDMKEADMRAIIENVSGEMKDRAEVKGLEYKEEFSDGEYKILGDESQLKEAVKNLVDNSINYTPSGSITLSLKREGDKIILAIKDTGVGLSDEVKPKLFTKGGHGRNSQRINVNSTGYGLAIVKGIVDAHKGRVWAESEGEGKGSTFYMELPVVK
jgi:signal transduction histidine kinase